MRASVAWATGWAAGAGERCLVTRDRATHLRRLIFPKEKLFRFGASLAHTSPDGKAGRSSQVPGFARFWSW
jgi:hypothetical protein